MFRKYFSLLLCALILASSFASCGETGTETAGADDTADTAAVAETLSAEEQKTSLFGGDA